MKIQIRFKMHDAFRKNLSPQYPISLSEKTWILKTTANTKEADITLILETLSELVQIKKGNDYAFMLWVEAINKIFTRLSNRVNISEKTAQDVDILDIDKFIINYPFFDVYAKKSGVYNQLEHLQLSYLPASRNTSRTGKNCLDYLEEYYQI